MNYSFSSEEMNKEILKALNEKCKLPCPACWEMKGRGLIPWFIVQTLQEKPLWIHIGGKTSTLVATSCKHCWHVHYHVLKILAPDIKYDDPTK